MRVLACSTRGLSLWLSENAHQAAGLPAGCSYVCIRMVPELQVPERWAVWGGGKMWNLEPCNLGLNPDTVC